MGGKHTFWGSAPSLLEAAAILRNDFIHVSVRRWMMI
jgi:hypothetical protein